MSTSPVPTVRLTVAQATIRFLVNQYSERDGVEQRFIAGAFGIFGHGNVAGLGQALLQNELDPEPDGGEMPYIMPRNEQGEVHAAAAYAKSKNRLQTYMCTASIGPGSLNMVTGAALATTNRVPVLLFPSDQFATRYPDPVLQQIENSQTLDTTCNDAFRPVSAFFDRINSAKNEDTDDWWNGMNRIYNVFCYDYLYPNPKSVMAFVENHDTDRFLGEGKDTLALKQALALLLTVNRTPQLYYGTEVLMNGTKSVTDGNVRKDFPGGWAGDKHNAFTAEGRTQAENQMFDWLSRLLHWRQGNEVITKGKQTQFCPQKGVYVIARQYKGKSVMTIINGKKEANELNVSRYAEIIGNAEKATDVTNGRTVLINKNVKLRPRQTMILEF